MTYNTLFLILLNFALYLLESLAWVELWQRKEYRLDRLKTSLNPRDNSLLVRPAVYLTFLVFSLLWPAALASSALHLYLLRTKGLFRPKFTFKVKIIILVNLGLSFAGLMLLLWAGISAAYSFAFLVLLAPPAVAASVLVANLLGRWRKKQIINQASAHRASLAGLKVVGVTGSWGKTSVKHFASQLIPQATVSDLRRNEEFVIAQDMLARLTPATPLYITEMAAYRHGEIAALCRLARPQTGLITAIGNQHLSLFGSLENIFQAKRELIDALPASGMAILNADDPRLAGLAAKLTRPVLLYSTHKAADVYFDHSEFKALETNSTLHLDDKTFPVKLLVPGEAALSNVCAAVALAYHVGEEPEQIVKRLSHLRPMPRTLEIMPGINGSTVIDDSYSSSEASVIGAMEHLARFPKPHQKILLVPLIELGPAAAAVHRRIAEQLAILGQPVLVFGTAFKSELTKAVPPDKLHLFTFFTTPASFTDAVLSDINSDTVVLVAGRIPEITRQKLLSNTRSSSSDVL